MASVHQMVPDASPIFYASVSKGAVVLAEVSSGNMEVEAVASKCLEEPPSLHRLYSHTAAGRIYSFLMEDQLVYFAIYDESFGKAQGLRFLNRVKNAFSKLLKRQKMDSFDSLTSYSLDEEFGPTFRYLMQLQPSEGETPRRSPKAGQEKDGHIGDLDAGPIASNVDVSFTDSPLVGKPNRYEKISRSLSSEPHGDSRELPGDTTIHVPIEGNSTRELGLPVQKRGVSGRVGGPAQARKIWRRYVRIVVFTDFVICSLLFGIWLSICNGFKCLAG